MSERWIEDAEGRHWFVRSPRLTYTDAASRAYAQPTATEVVRVKVEIELFCEVQPGQPLPDIEETQRRVQAAVTLGGTQRILAPSTVP